MTKHRIFVVIMLAVCFTPSLFSHPGRTDKNGGHNGPNGYHYHNGSGTTPPPQTTPPRQTRPSPAPITVEGLVLDADAKDNIFHWPFCELVKGKKVINITVSEARGSKYKPCTVCKSALPADDFSDIMN